MALLLFPFIAHPALDCMLGPEGDRFEAFINERKRTLADAALGGLRP